MRIKYVGGVVVTAVLSSLIISSLAVADVKNQGGTVVRQSCRQVKVHTCRSTKGGVEYDCSDTVTLVCHDVTTATQNASNGGNGTKPKPNGPTGVSGVKAGKPK